MIDEDNEPSWRECVRQQNQPGAPNVLLTLEDAMEKVKAFPDEYDKAMVFLCKFSHENKFSEENCQWFNAGMRTPEIVYMLAYLQHYFLNARIFGTS